MDLRLFFQNLRKIESEIPAPHVVVVSVDTADGGKAGVMTEVAREIAAKLIVENRARLATKEENEEYGVIHGRNTQRPAGPGAA